MASLSHTQPFRRARNAVFPLTILDRYLLREMLAPFLVAFAACLLFWALNIFFLAADYIVNQHAPIALTLAFVVFRMPQAIPMAFPFATLFATLFAMGRLMSDNEIPAVRTAGIPLLRIAAAPLAFGLAAFVVAWFSNEYVAAKSVDLSTRSFYQIIYHTNTLPVEPQLFRRDAATGTFYYVNEVAPDLSVMEGVQIYRKGPDHTWSQTLQAKSADVVGDSLRLLDLVDTHYDAHGYMTQQKHLASKLVPLPFGENVHAFVSSVNNDPWTMNSAALSRQIRILKSQGVGGTALGNLEINLANKLAWPFASFISVLLAVPLAVRFGKRGRMLGFALALILYFVYYVLATAMAAFGRNGAINPFVAAWIPNVLAGSAGAVLLWMEER